MKAFIFIFLFLFILLELCAQKYINRYSLESFIQYRNTVNHMPVDTIKYIKSFKLYVNANYKEYSAEFINYKYSDKYSLTSEISYFNYGYLSFALELKNKKGNYHEMEIMPILIKVYNITDYTTILSNNLTQATSGIKVTDIESNTSYQFNYCFNKKENSKISPYVGFGNNLYFNKMLISPYVSSTSFNGSTVIGFANSIIPGIKIKINSTSAIDINIPFRFFEFNTGRLVV